MVPDFHVWDSSYQSASADGTKGASKLAPQKRSGHRALIIAHQSQHKASTTVPGWEWWESQELQSSLSAKARQTLRVQTRGIALKAARWTFTAQPVLLKVVPDFHVWDSSYQSASADGTKGASKLAPQKRSGHRALIIAHQSQHKASTTVPVSQIGTGKKEHHRPPPICYLAARSRQSRRERL